MEGVTEGPAPLGPPGVAGQALPHGIFLCREAFLYILLLFWVLFCFLLSLRFYNLNSKPPEQMSDLLVIE